MKRIYLFLLVTCFISVHSVDARSTAEVLDPPITNSIMVNDYNLEIIIKVLEDLGFEIEELKFSGPEEEEKECTITLKGTYKGEDIDLTITIKGQTCAELLKTIMKS